VGGKRRGTDTKVIIQGKFRRATLPPFKVQTEKGGEKTNSESVTNYEHTPGGVASGTRQRTKFWTTITPVGGGLDLDNRGRTDREKNHQRGRGEDQRW